jgi:hypothetical protein
MTFGWLLWNAMRVLAALGLVVLGGSLALLVWFLFKVGFAWIGFVVIGLAMLLVFFTLRNLWRARRSP